MIPHIFFKAHFDLSEKIRNSEGTLIDNDLTMDYILGRLKFFENISMDWNNENETVMFVKKTTKFNANLDCFNCAGYGHLPKTCSSPKTPADFMPGHLKGFSYSISNGSVSNHWSFKILFQCSIWMGNNSSNWKNKIFGWRKCANWKSKIRLYYLCTWFQVQPPTRNSI